MRKLFYSGLSLLFIVSILAVNGLELQAQFHYLPEDWKTVTQDVMTNPDTNKVNSIISISRIAMLDYFYGRNPAKLKIIEDVLESIRKSSEKIGYLHGQNMYLLIKSRLLNLQGEDSIALRVYDQAMKFYKTSKPYYTAAAFYFQSGSWQFRTHSKDIFVADSSYYKNALAYFISVNNTLAQASLRRAIAFIYIKDGQTSLAEHELTELYKFQEKINDSSRHKTSDLLAHCYAITGRFNNAISAALQSLNYSISINDTVDFGLYFYRLGRITYNIHELDKGTNFLKQSLRMFELQCDTSMIIHINSIICQEGLMPQKKYQQALTLMLDVVKKYPSGAKDDKVLNRDVINTLAECYYQTGQPALAEKYYLIELGFVNNQGASFEKKIPIYFDVGMFYLRQGNLEKAKDFFQQTLTLSELTNSLPAIRDVQLQLFKVDSIQGNYASAIAHYQAYKIVTDSMFSEAKSNQVSELEIQYGTKQKEKELQLLTKQSELQAVAIQQGKIIRNATIAGAIMLMILALVFFSRYQIKHRANTELSKKQEEINLKNNELEKNIEDKNKLLDEKEWLIKEIHHRVKNNLQIVISLLNTQSNYLKTKEAIAAISESRHRMQAVSLVHVKLYESENAMSVSMKSYIPELAEHLSTSFDSASAINFELDIDDVYLNIMRAVPIGLILNEIITNAIKHAFAHVEGATVLVRMKKKENDEIMLNIKDNGKGLPGHFFDGERNSMGILLIEGLTRQIEGKLEYENDGGASFNITFKND
ncbi:MAG: ATP-binding protein [Bacteroidetes bacterium]|nr:ATP-binding protein [Bacteroidota bacterium]